MSTYQASNNLPFLQYMVMARLITKGEGLQKKSLGDPLTTWTALRPELQLL